MVSARGSFSVGIVPPLGPAYLAASLLASGHDVTAIDAVGEAPLRRGRGGHPDLVAHGLSIEEIVARLDPATSAVAVSVLFSQQWPIVESLIHAIHARLPDHPIFVGGEHATATWRFILQTCAPVTVCALGEGEETIVELAEYLDGDRSLNEIRGIAHREGGAISCTERRERIRDVDGIPRAAWELFPIETYLDGSFSFGVNLGRSMPILAARGCPHECTFCSSPQMWTTRYYARSVEDVVDEIESHVQRYRVTNIDFFDLTPFIERDWVLGMCDELDRRGISITYQLPAGTRCEPLDPEVLRAMYRSGCRNVCYAPESGSRRTLRRVKKRLEPERIEASITQAKAAGITVKANFMIGLPDETRRDLLQTLGFATKLVWLGADDTPLFPFVPYPGSQLFDELTAEGALPEMNNDFFAKIDFMDLTSATSVTRHISSLELGLTRLLGMGFLVSMSYARRPRRIARTLRNLATSKSDTVFEQKMNDLKRRIAHRDKRPASATKQGPTSSSWFPRGRE